jgi:hypothetical protein
MASPNDIKPWRHNMAGSAKHPVYQLPTTISQVGVHADLSRQEFVAMGKQNKGTSKYSKNE